MGKVFFNGKFYSAQMTGVHRVAEELLRALDGLLDEEGAAPMDATILRPSNASKEPDFKNIRPETPGRLPWIWWEQLELPWRSRNNLLVNLCNLGPLANKGGLTMIHDAQVYITPESYSRAFVTWYRVALPTLGARSRCLLTVSEYSKQMLVRHGVAKAENIRVIPNGVDHMLKNAADFGVMERLGLEQNSYVLALASTHAHKNIRVLFKTFEQLQESGIKLVLIGAATRIDFEAKDETPPPNVVFAGRVSDREMRGLMERAVCFACPSITEGFGLPPLEAMLVGCPAVIAPCGALPEVCGSAALSAAPDDPTAWAAAIRKLHTDPALRAAQIKAGIEQASRFTWRNSAKLLAQAINDYVQS